MASILYVVVPESGAKQVNLIGVRTRLANGCYLLRDKDLSGLEGNTLFERASKVKGAIVSESEASLILNGRLPIPIENDSIDNSTDTSDAPDEETKVHNEDVKEEEII